MVAYDALPLTVKCRRPPQFERKLLTEEDIVGVVESIRTEESITPDGAFLKLMADYGISPALFGTLAPKLKQSFSRVKMIELAPYFNLPTGGSPPEDIPLYKSRLPLPIIKKTCELVQYATYEFGALKRHCNEESRSRYLASLFRVVLSIFHGTIINRPEETIQGQVTANGKIEHVFYAFSNSVIVFVEVKADLGAGRKGAVAQVIAECDSLDYENSTYGYWCPILGVLSDSTSFQLFVYDSSTREVFCSEPCGALNPMADGLDFLKCIRNSTSLVLLFKKFFIY